MIVPQDSGTYPATGAEYFGLGSGGAWISGPTVPPVTSTIELARRRTRHRGQDINHRKRFHQILEGLVLFVFLEKWFR